MSSRFRLIAFMLCVAWSGAASGAVYFNNSQGDNSFTNDLNWSDPVNDSGGAAVNVSGADEARLLTGEVESRPVKLLLGNGAGTTGEMTVDGGDLTASQFIDIGQSGTGTFHMVNGSVQTTTYDINVGTVAGASGTLNMSGGTLTAERWLYVGEAGTGVMNMYGGTNIVEIYDFSLADLAGASGTLTMTNGHMEVARDFIVGEAGDGVMTMSGGTINVGSVFRVAEVSGSSGQLNFSGGTINAADFIIGSGTKTPGMVAFSGSAALILLGDKGSAMQSYVDDGYITGAAVTVTNGQTIVGEVPPPILPLLPAVFSDGMVLQRNEQVPVWGWTDAGSTVTVQFAGQTKVAVADTNGTWQVLLDPMAASFISRTLQASSSSGDQASVSDVLVGEVWLCSGQSNMQMDMQNMSHYAEDLAASDLPGIRMFETVRIDSLVPLDDCIGTWSVCSSNTLGDFSAVAFLFGRGIYEELNVPVGLLNSSMGGTKIETWSPTHSLTGFPTVMAYKQQEDDKAAAGDPDAQPWKYYPGKLYNGMVHPLAPYNVRGMIWYQGESNAHSVEESELYRDLVENLVVSWRAEWGEEFPAYAVQLPNYNSPASDGDAWQYMRESVLNFSKEVPNVGMAITIDAGDPNDIHPTDKRPVGHRLAQRALDKTYGVPMTVSGGPIYESATVSGNQITIEFSDVGSGLVAQGGAPLTWFTIAGDDRNFVAADAVVSGNTVVVSSPSVASPASVRYAWDPNPEGCNLFNAEGFPASPFRTDVWSPFEEGVADVLTIDDLATTYTQDFSSLPSSGTTLAWTNNSTLLGWYREYWGATVRDSSVQTSGASNSGVVSEDGLLNVGVDGTTDRALVMRRAFTLDGATGLVVQNASGEDATGFALGYSGEQWRMHGTDATSLYLEYSVVSSHDAGGFDILEDHVWTRVDALEFVSPRTGSNSGVNGNLAANRTVISPVTVSAAVADGDFLAIRWYQDRTDTNGASSTARHALGINDVSLSLNAGAITNPPAAYVVADFNDMERGNMTPAVQPAGTGQGFGSDYWESGTGITTVTLGDLYAWTNTLYGAVQSGEGRCVRTTSEHDRRQARSLVPVSGEGSNIWFSFLVRNAEPTDVAGIDFLNSTSYNIASSRNIQLHGRTLEVDGSATDVSSKSFYGESTLIVGKLVLGTDTDPEALSVWVNPVLSSQVDLETAAPDFHSADMGWNISQLEVLGICSYDTKAESSDGGMLDAIRISNGADAFDFIKATAGSLPANEISRVPMDLHTPLMTNAAPAPGQRVKATLAAYAGTDVYHALYLPTDWEAGKKYPVIVEYAGNGPYINKYGDTSAGTVEGSNLGYGISGGEGFIWVCMPFVSADLTENEISWWGDIDASVEYCKDAVTDICQNYGGDSNAVFLAGFSRGAIACNYIGLHDDSIAALWKGFIVHSHYDGVREDWPYPDADRASAAVRLARLGGRPQFISQENSVAATQSYLQDACPDGDFTFQVIPYRNHQDTWPLRESPERTAVRQWLVEAADIQPSLQMQTGAAGGGMQFSWPDSVGEYVIQGASELAPVTSWTAVTNPVVLSNGIYRVWMPFEGTNRFFRLLWP